MAEETQDFDTVSLDQLDPIALALDQIFAVANVNGKLFKSKLSDLIAFVAPLIPGVSSSNFAPVTGTVLPNNTSSPSQFTFVGSGIFTQTTGGNIVTTSLLNLLGWNGTTWVLLRAIDTSAFISKSDYNFGGKFASLTAANAAILNTVVNGVNQRDGKRVDIGSAGRYTTYWWNGGYSDVNLVPYLPDISSINSELSTPILDPYIRAFDDLISVSPANKTYINNTPITTRGVLNDIKIKVPVGSTVTPYAYSISGTNGNYIYTILHTYTPFVTTTLDTTKIINDGYICEVGTFIGVKSSLGFYFIASGANTAFDTTSQTVAAVYLSFGFTINRTLTTSLKNRVINLEANTSTLPQRVSALETSATEITSIKSTVGVGAVETPHTIDFTTLTSTTSTTKKYTNSTVPLVGDRIKSIRIKTTVGATVSAFIYSISSNGSGGFISTQLHAYPTFTSTSAEATYQITDTYVPPAGSFLMVNTSGSTYFSGSSGGYQIDSGGTTLTSGVLVAFDYITVSGATGLVLQSQTNSADLNTVKSQVTALISGNYTNVILKPIPLYKTIFQSVSDFTAVGWTADSTTGVIPSAIGSSNSLWLKKRFHVNPRMMSMELTLMSDSIFYIECAPIDYTQGNGIFSIDFTTNKLNIIDSSAVVVTTGTISFTLISGRRYSVTLFINDFVSNFSIKDTVTGQVYQLDYIIPLDVVSQNRQQDSYKFYLQSGSTSGVKIHNMGVYSKKSPLIMVCGDSISEGVYFNSSNISQNYARLLKSKLRGNVLISARGGAVLADIANTLETEALFIKPDYVMLTIGTNGGGWSQAALTAIVNRIFDIGSIPIVNHIPNLNGGLHVTRNQDIDAVCLATGAIRGALFDVATSISGNPTNGYIAASYFDAGVHPNITGHLAMFNRFDIDLPMLFL